MDKISRGDIGNRLIRSAGPMFVINLDSRKDRLNEFRSEISKIGLSFRKGEVERYAAIKPERKGGFQTIGTRGAYLSHLSVMKLALKEKFERVLICEDDLQFSSDFKERALGMLSELDTYDWDMTWFSYNVSNRFIQDWTGFRNVGRDYNLGGLHFYSIKLRVLPKIIEFLEKRFKIIDQGHGGFGHVDDEITAFRNSAGPEFQTLVASPPLGIQSRSRSDIQILNFYDKWPILRSISPYARRLLKRRF